jgi:phage/plasmid-like protein (TIGR03299 family)
MAHEITKTDGLVLTGQGAWHGLGLVVEQAPTPEEACRLAGIDWRVIESMGVYGITELSDGNMVRILDETHKLLVRSDTQEVLGCVSSGYVPLQNIELANFCSSLAEDGDIVRVESAATICGGKLVWFLLRGQSFSVKGWDDEVRPYLLATTSHDGTRALSLRPTSIRVVCKNTLSLAMGRSTDLRIRITHQGDLGKKLYVAKQALGLFGAQVEQFREKVDVLSSRSMTREDLQRFFLEVYTEAYNPIPANPTTNSEREKAQMARQVIGVWGREFDREVDRVGGTAWAAMNAVTGWMQHLEYQRASDPHAGLRSWLFGGIEDRTNTVAKVAMELVK